MKRLFVLASRLIIPVSVIFGVGGMFVVADAASAVPNILSGVTTPSGLDNALFCPIISWMFWILISVSVIMVMYAAYLYAIAQEDTEKTNKARRTITYAAVAVVVALVALGFPALISNVVNKNITWSCGSGGSSNAGTNDLGVPAQ
jgi:cytochrome bd-type quinol oxidase subunit 2